MEELKEAGGEGGMIAIDRHGHVQLQFNTEGMYRGWCEGNGKIHTAIYAD